MPRGKKYGPEEIIPKLREAEVLMSQGTTQELAAKQIGVSTQTLIRWRTPSWIRRSSRKLRRETSEPGEAPSSSRSCPRCSRA